MDSNIYAVIGAGGCGRGVMPIVRENLKSSHGLITLVFVDDALAGQIINGHHVLSYAEFMRYPANKRYAVIAIANERVRRLLAHQLSCDGVSFFSAIASNAVQMDDVVLGPGSIISPYVTITSNVLIGSHFHANLYSYVEHDCRIGNFVTFAPGVKCNGNVHIGDGAYIGSNAVIRQGNSNKPLLIGEGAVIGMGSVVLNDVPAGFTVVGNPARVLRGN